MWGSGLAQKGVYVMQSLMKGKDFFKAQQTYIWKAGKGVAEIKFSILRVKKSGKACEESYKTPCENTSKPPFLKKDFSRK